MTIAEAKSNEQRKEIIDEDEFTFMNSLKDAKKDYRTQYEALQKVKSDMDYCARLVDQCRRKLMSEFETWFDHTYGHLMTAGNTTAGEVPRRHRFEDVEVCLLNRRI
jgi:kinesin family protein 6/9